MRLSLDALLVLDAIDRRGSFAAAAQGLHRVPSAVSYTIQRLEQDLGLRLFERRGRRAVLTPAGELLLAEGRQLLNSAAELESRVKRVATGWEAELCLAVDHLVDWEGLYPVLQDFYAQDCGTRLRLRSEVFGGTWDALSSGRADLVVGASGDGPPGGGYVSRPVGEAELVLVCSPDHPLAKASEPVQEEEVQRHRVIVVADTSLVLAPRTAGLLPGQDTITVPDLGVKLALLRRGVGVGRLPRRSVLDDLRVGRLIAKRVLADQGLVPLALAWRARHKGKALQWFVSQLLEPAVAKALAGR